MDTNFDKNETVFAMYMEYLRQQIFVEKTT